MDEWCSPLRPASEDVTLYENSIGKGDRTLLLGMTAELMHLADVLVDNNPRAIELAKEQEDRACAAILADWGDLPFNAYFDAVIGDGALNAFQGRPDRFFAQMKKVLKPGGRLVLRVFISPEQKDKLEEVLQFADRANFHAFKWRVAHVLANPYVRVQELFDVIHPVYPHSTLAVYKESPLVYYFPKLRELPASEHTQFAVSYELAERCPVITWQFH